MTMSQAFDNAVTPAIDPDARAKAASAPPTFGRALFAQPLVPMLTAAAVVVLVVACILFARSAGLVAALWGAGGVAMVVWLRTSRDRGYDIAFGLLMTVAILAGEFLAGNTPMLSALFTVANMVEIIAAVALTRRFAPTLSLSSVEGAVRFLLTAAVFAPIPAGLMAAGTLAAMTGSNFLEGFQTWWFGHALGIAVIGALGLSLTRRNLVAFRSPLKLVEAVVLLSMLTTLCAVMFSTIKIPIGFTILPILLAVAVRLKVVGIAAALVIITVLAVGGTMMGHGPYSHVFQGAQSALMAQLLVLFGYLPLLLVASLLEERDQLALRAKAGQRRAELASEAKSRLLANVAHEIKSPAGGVIGIGELWKNGQLGPVTETQADMAEMLVKTARQLEALSHDLLDVARAESGAVKVELRPTDVNGLLEDVRRSVALRREAEGLRLVVDCEPGVVALADSQRLMQVVGNLASNAVKYGASGGEVTFRAVRSDMGVRIEVSDRGPGLTPEKQAQLFEPFNRLGLERSTIEGHGVGLTLAKRLTELQGGTIGVVSAPGEGATFWVELPPA